jgi:hypothetical protein
MLRHPLFLSGSNQAALSYIETNYERRESPDARCALG